MTKIYAYLLGNWVCLNADPDSTIGDWYQTPDLRWKEGDPIYDPAARNTEIADTLYCLDYVKLHYKGKDYRINPICIQVVTE